VNQSNHLIPCRHVESGSDLAREDGFDFLGYRFAAGRRRPLGRGERFRYISLGAPQFGCPFGYPHRKLVARSAKRAQALRDLVLDEFGERE
jgi:hypothetical protein